MLIVQSIRRMGFLATLLLLASTPSARASTTATPLRLKVQGEGPVAEQLARDGGGSAGQHRAGLSSDQQELQSLLLRDGPVSHA